MEQKTIVAAQEGTHDILITREFELPVELLFKAYEDAEIVAQWMNTHVVQLENKSFGAYVFETTDLLGNIHRFSGVHHAFVPNKQIIRTFEMENTAFPVQLEYLDFEALSTSRSKLTMHIIFKSVAHRDQLLKMPFAMGINMAHQRLETILSAKLS